MIISAQRDCTISPSAHKRRRGFTLTEIAIVLGIVGLILGAVWAAAKNVYSNVNSAKATEITSILIANVRGAYGTSQPEGGDFAGAFGNIVYGTGGGAQINADVQGLSVQSVPGFAVAFDGTSNGAPGTVTPLGFWTGTDATGSALCNGLLQAGQALSGAISAYNIATLQTAPPTGQCTKAGKCPAGPTGWVGGPCSGSGGTNGTGTCSYYATNSNKLDTNGYDCAVFIPYTPS
jgi:prepilin-type N-terminal cleavage/methylation domain-containing protein